MEVEATSQQQLQPIHLGSEQPPEATSQQLHSTIPKHLIFLVHGNHGHSDDMTNVEIFLRKIFGSSALIVRSKANQKNTEVGIEVGGMRLADEIKETLDKIFANNIYTSDSRPNRKILFSIVGHSLGGLFIRNAIRWLFEDETSLAYQVLEPTSYVSLNSPHLGSRRPGGKFHQSAWRAITHLYLNFNGQTGKELALLDAKSPDECLLTRMTLPDSPYIKQLVRFKHRTLIAATHHDILVPYSSASIRTYNPYAVPTRSKNLGFQIAGYSGFDTAYQKIFAAAISSSFSELHKNSEEFARGTELQDYCGIPNDRSSSSSNNNNNATTEPLFHCDNVRHVEFYPAIIKNLHKLSWRRMCVEFSLAAGSDQFLVHDLTIAKVKKGLEYITRRKSPIASETDSNSNSEQQDQHPAFQFLSILATMLGKDHGVIQDEEDAAEAIADIKKEVETAVATTTATSLLVGDDVTAATAATAALTSSESSAEAPAEEERNK